MAKLTLFYGSLVYGTYDKWPKISELGEEVYNSGYMHSIHSWTTQPTEHWYRCDATPFIYDDLPPQIKLAAILLDLP